MSIEKTYEITLVDPLTEHEYAWLEEQIGRQGFDTAVNSNGRILLIESEDEVEEIITLLARCGIADDVGLIRQIIEFEPERRMVELEFVNDKE